MHKISDKKLLVTTSLIDSFEWFQKCPDSWKERAWKDLEGTLKRSKTWEPTPEIERGIKFESMVNTNVKNKDTPEAFKEHFPRSCNDVKLFYDKCKGGAQQVSLSKTLVIGEQFFKLYGKADIVFPGQKIIDIKTTGKSKTSRDYGSKLQHWAYCYMADIVNFEYIVAEFIDAPYCTGVKCFEFQCPSAQAEEQIIRRISFFIDFIKDHEDLMKAWINVFTK